MIQKVLLDTNFILIPAYFKVDIYAEINRLMLGKYEVYVLDKTMDELNKIIETQ